jgi:hypothetical protein
VSRTARLNIWPAELTVEKREFSVMVVRHIGEILFVEKFWLAERGIPRYRDLRLRVTVRVAHRPAALRMTLRSDDISVP